MRSAKREASPLDLYGWWQRGPAESLLRKTDGARFQFVSEAAPPDALSRLFVFQTHVPGLKRALVPVECVDRIRASHYLVWRAHLEAAQGEDGTALIADPASPTIERFLIDALCAWPDSASTGMRPGSIELIGGRVNGRIEKARWRSFHSTTSSDTRPRWPGRGFDAPPSQPWRLVRPPNSERLPSVPDFSQLSRRDYRSWLEGRLHNAPRLISGARVLFPLCREFNWGLRWVYCDEDIIFDRLRSQYQGLHPSSAWHWSCPEWSIAGTRTARGSRVDWAGEKYPRPSLPSEVPMGVAESYHLPAWVSQRLADVLPDASYALEDMALSATDIRTGERGDFQLIAPRSLNTHLAIAGGILPISIEEGLDETDRRHKNSTPPVVVDGSGPRFRWDAARSEIRDGGSGRSLAYVGTLKGDASATQDQWFALRYHDAFLEFPVFVRRRTRTDGYRPKPWFADLRGDGGAERLDESVFTAIRNFVAAALSGWPDSELTGPAPPSAVLLGGYLNTSWREDYAVLASSADPTKLAINPEWIDPCLAFPMTHWTVTRGGRAEAPPPAPQTGAGRRPGFLAEWLGTNPHGTVVSADGKTGLMAVVGSITTSGHGGGTTVYWDYEDASLWLRLTSGRFGWNVAAAGPIEGADPAVFAELVRPRTEGLFLCPQLQLEVDRARLALAEDYGSAELEWLAIDGAMIPFRNEHFLEGSRPPAVWHAAGDDWLARVWPTSET